MASKSSTATAKPAVVTESASTPIKQLGICSTCKHVERCLFVRAAHQPIWFCEEFDEQGGEERGSPKKATRQPMAAPVNGEARSSGICDDCAERSDCEKRIPGEAVTECADYR